MDADVKEVLDRMAAQIEELSRQTNDIAAKDEQRDQEHKAKLPALRRAHTAMVVLQGLCANPDADVRAWDDVGRAQVALDQADALMKLLGEI